MELNHDQSASALSLVVRIPDHVRSLKKSKFKKPVLQHPLGANCVLTWEQRERESALGSEERGRGRERERE